MAITWTNVIMQLGDANTLLYTCPASTTARINKATACNDTTVAETFDINKVPNGDAVDPANLVENDKAIASKDTIQILGLIGAMLSAGDKIYGIAGTADQITIDLGIVENV